MTIGLLGYATAFEFAVGDAEVEEVLEAGLCEDEAEIDEGFGYLGFEGWHVEWLGHAWGVSEVSNGRLEMGVESLLKLSGD